MLSKCLNKELFLQSDGGVHFPDNTGLADYNGGYCTDDFINSLASSFELTGGLKNNPVFFHWIDHAGCSNPGCYFIELRSYPPFDPPVEVYIMSNNYEDRTGRSSHEFATVCKLEVRISFSSQRELHGLN